MADNTTLNAASGGDVIATDDVGGIKFQRVKLALGADGTAADAPVGGGVEAGVLRVTLASDSTGVLSVDDNGSTLSIDDGGGSITVDGTVAVSGTVTVGSHAVTNAGTFATQVDGAALTALQLIDNIVLAEDAVHASGDPGVMSLAVRRDANTTMVSADGDYSPLQVDSSGSLKVAVISGGGSGGTSATDDAAFTAASGSGTPIMGFATSDAVDSGDVGVVAMTTTRSLKTVVTNSSGTVIDPQVDDAAFTPATGLVSVIGGIVTADSVDSGDAGAVAMTTARALHVAVQGTVAVTDNSGSLTVDNGGTFAVQATVAAGATNIAKAEDVASADADVGVPAMAVRKATPANTSGTDGDYEMLQMSAGRLWVDPSGVTLTVASHAVTNAGTFATQSTLQTGSSLVGDVGISGARTSGGTTIFRSLDIDETEEEIKATAGQIYWIHAMNLVNAKRYLKFYNATAANVTVGTTTPVLTFPLPTQGDTNGAGFTLAIPNGIAFGTAITVACTTGLADNDTGAPGANDVVINVGYA